MASMYTSPSFCICGKGPQDTVLAPSNILRALYLACKAYCPCRQHYLHSKNLREAAALHSQLLRQLAGSVLLPSVTLPRSPPALELPSQKVLLLLQRAIAAGWADQVRAHWGCICTPWVTHHWSAHSAKLQQFWLWQHCCWRCARTTPMPHSSATWGSLNPQMLQRMYGTYGVGDSQKRPTLVRVLMRAGCEARALAGVRAGACRDGGGAHAGGALHAAGARGERLPAPAVCARQGRARVCGVHPDPTHGEAALPRRCPMLMKSTVQQSR